MDGSTKWHSINRQTKLYNPVGASGLQLNLDLRKPWIDSLDSTNPYRVDAFRLGCRQLLFNKRSETRQVWRSQAIDQQAFTLDAY
jgi:hypothetical protein